MIHIKQLTLTRTNNAILTIEALTLPHEGAIALIGPNGSGKTTLIKCLTGIERLPKQSQLLINNKPLKQYSQQTRASLLGYIPQSFTPAWNQTVIELLTLAASRTHDPLALPKACHQFELETLQTNHWQTLSGGEKARVLAAMALMGDPPLLIADEPGAALDIKHRLQLIKQLAHYGEQQLAIICLHELELVFRYFKKVILLNKGKIAFYGNTADLLHNPILDSTFDVHFKRLKQDGYYLLYPELTP